MNDRIRLVPGCRCSLRLSDDIRVRGVFRGFSLLCEENVLVIEADGGTIKMVPESQILLLDILEMPETEAGKPNGNGAEHWYG